MTNGTGNKGAWINDEHAVVVPDQANLRIAGPSLAMAWFSLRGIYPAVPAEIRPHDLLVETSSGVKRVQVKTTNFMESPGSWSVSISRHAGGGYRHDHRVPYRPDEIDLFVVFDGDLELYLIPLSAVSGRLGVCLRLYRRFIVGSAASMLQQTSVMELRNTDSAGQGALGISGKMAARKLTAGSVVPESAPARYDRDDLVVDPAEGGIKGQGESALEPRCVPARWTEAELTVAVEKARSWADLLRAFGYKPSSTNPREALRQHVQRYGISTSHFAGKRTWSDEQLITAAIKARTWAELCTALGLAASTRSYGSVVAAASRLGVSLHQFRLGPKCGPEALDINLPYRAERANVRRAAQAIATAWFLLGGCAVSAPYEPAIYDLIVDMPGGLKRVQVKSTTTRGTRGSWTVRIGHRPDGASHTARLVPYRGDDLDLFFIVDGNMMLYLIPSSAVAGKISLTLRGYRGFIVGDASSLMEQRPPAE